MPPARTQTLRLSAAQEAVITGAGAVTLRLTGGVLCVAGASLAAGVDYTYHLHPDCRALVVYSLEGGSATVTPGAGAAAASASSSAGPSYNNNNNYNSNGSNSYSSGGGESGGASVAIHVSPVEASAVAVTQLVQRRLVRRRQHNSSSNINNNDPSGRGGTRVLVVGSSKSGKTLTAHTICNLLHAHLNGGGYNNNNSSSSNNNSYRSSPAAPPRGRVVYVSLNSESNDISAPGCVAAVELPPGGWASVTPVTPAPLTLGQVASPALPLQPISLYTGRAAPPNAACARLHTHLCEQLVETVAGALRESSAPPPDWGGGTTSSNNSSPPHYIVMEAPAPAEDLQEGVFYKGLAAALRPTHVVLVADRAREPWAAYLAEDLPRALPDCDVTFVRPTTIGDGGGEGSGNNNNNNNNLLSASASASAASSSFPATSSPGRLPFSPRLLLQTEYFCGPPGLPLGCSKAVAALSDLRFVRYQTSSGVGVGGTETGGNDQAVSVVAAAPAADWAGLVVALSHAAVPEEVPLAPVAALLLLLHVDTEHNELTFVMAAALDTPVYQRAEGEGEGGSAHHYLNSNNNSYNNNTSGGYNSRGDGVVVGSRRVTLPCRYVVVPDLGAPGAAAGVRLTDAQIATIEESIVAQ